MANYRILLIDYEPRSIERFRDPLVGAGYSVEIANDGISGVEAFHRLNPDMVLVEAMIPKKHGFEVCQELKKTPHGRRTPILITTGVYKGRKYRTQALHVYGCDEYIEKPIAPEQLLEVVGRFFGPGVSVASEQLGEALTVSSAQIVQPTQAAQEAPHAEAAARPEIPAKPPKLFASISPLSADNGEAEIMARLDAILPGAETRPVAIQPALPEPFSADEAFADAVDNDPLAQIRAELNAELNAEIDAVFGPSSGDVALASIPSDHAGSPSVLQTLPEPATIVELPAPIKTQTESKKHRKGKNKGRNKSGGSSERFADPSSPAPEPLKAVEPPPEATPEKAPLAAPEAAPPKPQLAPAPRLATPQVPAAARLRVPVWVWAGGAIVAAATIYFVFFASSGDAQRTEAQRAPAPVQTASEAKAPPHRVPDPPAEASDKLVLNAISAMPRMPKKRAEPATGAHVPATAVPSAAPSALPSADEAVPTTAEPNQVVPQPTTDPSTAPAPVPHGPDDTVQGVETVPAAPVTTPPTSIAPGTLVPIDEADVVPVSVSRKLPVLPAPAGTSNPPGSVVMNVLVSERGTVDQVVLVKGVASGDVNETVMKAAKSWTYHPATRKGVPLKVWVSEQVLVKR